MRRRGFTLMEIVLSIALMSVVMYLLTTAIEMFMIRIESSRGRVESAQVARTLLDRMAADLVATRLYAPPSSAGGQSGGEQSGGGSQTGAGQTGAGGTGGSPPAASGSTGGASAAAAGDDLLTQSDVHGIYGTIDQIRIDRTAIANWERASRRVEPEEAASTADMPVTVRYYVVEGDRLTSAGLAQRGVPEDDRRSTSTAGLYRSTRPTASLAEGADPLDESAEADADAELLAPEVVKLELQYFDGTDLADTWDAYEAGGLPAGVEIRLTVYEPRLEPGVDEEAADRASSSRFRENELVEYRRFVRIPSISPQQPAEALLPAGESGEDGEQRGGQGGSGADGQGGAGGQNGTGQGGAGNQGGGQGSGQN